MKTPKSKRHARCSRPTCSRSSLSDRLRETPKTDAVSEEIHRNNWRQWVIIEQMEEHARQLERSENKLKHRIKMLLKHRGHVAAEAVMDKMAEEISSENSQDRGRD